MDERRGEEPLWRAMDRLLDELLRLRGHAAARRAQREPRRPPLFPASN
jgi:hypothetical protein